MQVQGEAALRWCRCHSYLLAVVAITLLAAAVRIYRIETFPPGLHGDEAWTGLDARRVLAEGWIGPYVPSALGQPSGPLYWTAAVFKVIGDGVLQLRLSMAVLGIATVPLTYWAARQMFDRRTAVVAAVLMAFMGWHIMFSRTAFMVTAQPLLEVIFLGTFFTAYKRQSYVLYAVAGAVLGLGVYSYNAYPVFVAATGVFAVVLLVFEYKRWRTLIPRLALMFAVAFVVALPLTSYIRDEKNDYLAHHRAISVLYKPEFEEETLPGKARILIDHSIDWVRMMTIEPKVDYTDATGTTPVVDRLTLVLLLVGIGLCARRSLRSPPHLALLIYLLIMPVAGILTIEYGAVRRSLGLSPVLAMLAALPLATVWEWAGLSIRDKRSNWKAAVACLVLLIAVVNVRTYFKHTGDSAEARWVYVEQLAEASKYIESLPSRPYVYFYSSRWAYDYETRRYLAADLKGENRSTEFGKRINARGELEMPPGVDYDARVPSVVLLLPAYFNLLEEVEKSYPGGVRHIGRNGQGEVLYIAYTLSNARR